MGRLNRRPFIFKQTKFIYTMLNFIKNGGIIEYTNNTGSAIKSGDVVVMAGLIGIAVVDIAINDRQSVYITGMYEVNMNGAIPATGAALYWDAANNRADTVHTVGPFCGNVGSQDVNVAGKVRVVLPGNGFPPSAFITQQSNVPVVATANASDLATAIALANSLKTSLNLLLGNGTLKSAGVTA